MSTEESIMAIIRTRNGIMAKEIARLLGLQKSDVNSMLYKLQDKHECYQEGYSWFANGIQRAEANTDITSRSGFAVDETLSNLCKYYLNCLALDESNAVSLFQHSNFETAYLEVNGIERGSIFTEKVCDFLCRAASAQKALFMGYPVMVDNRTGRNGTTYRFLSPVFMFPVEYSAGNVQISQFPRINLELMRKYASRDKNEQILELVKLENDLGLNDTEAEFDTEDLVMKLQNTRDWNWIGTMNPDNLFDEALSDITEDGIYNKAMVFFCDKSPYTQGLENELEELSHKGESQYRGTALYDWLHGSIVDETQEKSDSTSLLEVLPLNIEQGDAVKTALNSRLTIVTGPPGTGKSQVVTDLIVNLAWRGKSAIFSSKNNKAVDVVEQRVNNLGPCPVMIRLGSASCTTGLIEFFKGLLSIKSGSLTERSDYNQLKSRYDEYVRQSQELVAQKSQIVSERNRLDELERSFCAIRDYWCNYLNDISELTVSNIRLALNSYDMAWKAAQKDHQPLFVRLLWFTVKAQRNLNLDRTIQSCKAISCKYLRNENDFYSPVGHAKYMSEAEKMLDEMTLAVEYIQALKRMESAPSLEMIDKKLHEISKSQESMAGELWNKWLAINSKPVLGPLRVKLSDFIAQAQLVGDIDVNDDPTLKKMYSAIKNQLNGLLPITAITSLSANRRIPLQAGLYDVVIIDEASQCDIASIVPLLYRARHAVIIGDPKQLSHISTILNKQDRNLIERYRVSPSWSFSVTSLYGLAESLAEPDNIIQLKDHHRCHGNIIGFSNKEFYNGSLRVATNYDKLVTPRGDKPGIRWINVEGQTNRPPTGSAINVKEAEAVISEFKRLIDTGYQGSLGCVTPFRSQAETIQNMVEQNSELCNILARHQFMADTVHKFQGDERDVMLFSTVISQGAKDGAIGFLRSNGNLFNVAITRARSELIVIGNKNYCGHSTVPYLENFVKYYDRLESEEKIAQIPAEYGRDYPSVSASAVVSDWEIVLYKALFDAGIKTIPQYGVDKYFLDLAVFANGKKLDIEVDGERYHMDWNGELCYRDQLRNQRLYELGWDVKRFWVYQLRDDLPFCVREIKRWIENN